VRTDITVEDVQSFLDEPLVAVLATLRADGTVLLSPVWHEWHDGGFNVWVEAENVKARHLRRDPRATIVVAESDAPLREVEVRGSARFIAEGVTDIARRIATRYIGEDDAAADTEALRGADVIVRDRARQHPSLGVRRRVRQRLTRRPTRLLALAPDKRRARPRQVRLHSSIARGGGNVSGSPAATSWNRRSAFGKSFNWYSPTSRRAANRRSHSRQRPR
jgi:PPOX class probable F420-dependent enzyme